jgi:phytoene dehydrogenase-like protein
MTTYDGIIIGGGPNGLTTAAYMARAGLKVLVLERRMEIGGGLATEKVTIPGWIHNTHAVYNMMVDYAPVFQDLGLIDEYKLDFVRPDLVMTMPLSDGRAVCLYADPQKTAANFAHFSKADAEAYLEMHRHYTELTSNFLAPATYERPHPAIQAVETLQRTEIGRAVNELSEKTPRQIVNSWFESEHIRGLMLYAACFWGLDYDLEGVGFLVPLMLERASNYQLLKGGSHQLSNRLSKDIYAHGGMILGSQLIKRFIIEGDRAVGVELEDGTVYRASKFVASSLDPHQTFMEYVGEQHLDEDFVTRVKDWEWDTWSLNGVHLALEVPPDFTAARWNPDVNKAFVYVLGYDTDEDVIDHYDAIFAGELLADAGFNACFPSVHDPYQAPPGKASGLLSEHAPYKLYDGGAEAWYRIREEHANELQATLRSYAPNMTEDNIVWRYLSTPKDVENKFRNMVHGSIKHGAYKPLQMGYLRPNEDCSHNRTPIDGLYVCGASVFPGGMVTFGPGYCAALTLAEDLGLDKWWQEPAHVTRARQLGLLDPEPYTQMTPSR